VSVAFALDKQKEKTIRKNKNKRKEFFFSKENKRILKNYSC